MHRVLPTLTMLLLAALAGCSMFDREPHPTPDKFPAPAMTPGDDRTRSADAPVMVRVNGRPLYMDELHEILVRTHGLPVARQLISTEVVRREAAKLKITITDADVQRENGVALREAFGVLPEPDQRERMLREFLDRFKVSRNRWKMTMRRNAYLAKMAEPRVQVGEDEIEDEFGRLYGRGVIVRDIQTTSLAAAQRVRREAILPGADFAKLAFKHSVNKSGKKGGLLPPITEKTEGVIPALRRAAMAMKNIGEVSDPIMVGSSFHILYLEEVIPPKDVEFADVKDEIAAGVRQNKAMFLKQEILRELFAKAKIEFVDATLKKQSAEEEGP